MNVSGACHVILGVLCLVNVSTGYMVRSSATVRLSVTVRLNVSVHMPGQCIHQSIWPGPV